MSHRLDIDTLKEMRDNAQTSREQYLAMELLAILEGRPANCFSETELYEFGREMFFAGWHNSRYDPNPNYEYGKAWRDSAVYEQFHQPGVKDAETTK